MLKNDIEDMFLPLPEDHPSDSRYIQIQQKIDPNIGQAGVIHTTKLAQQLVIHEMRKLRDEMGYRFLGWVQEPVFDAWKDNDTQDICLKLKCRVRLGKTI